MLASESLGAFILKLHNGWRGVVFCELYHKVVYLIAFVVELVLAKEDATIVSPSAVILETGWQHRTLRVYD